MCRDILQEIWNVRAEGISGMMRRIRIGMLATLIFGGIAGDIRFARADFSFGETVIDSDLAGDVKGIGDVNGDGFPDVVIGGLQMNWYEYPSWTKHTIASANVEFTTDMQMADIDGDGDVDIVTGDGNGANNVVWLENPLPSGDPVAIWTIHTVGTHGDWVHDVQVADVDRDGKLDIVSRKTSTRIFFQNTPASWTGRDISSAVADSGEGMGAGDVDGDGDIDLIVNSAWIETPVAARTGTFVKHPIASGYGTEVTGTVADINADTYPDILMINQHSRGKFAWYEGTADPISGPWMEHVIDSNIGSHKLEVGDMDNDGDLDVVVGLELQELALYESSGGTSPAFAKVTLSMAGSHNQRIGDIGNDGDLDIFGANYIGHPPVSLWENHALDALPINQWTYDQITSSHSQTFGLDFGDVDGDGKTDIVSGQYWYRNPGGNMSGEWVQSAALPSGMEVMLFGNVDDDLLPDLIAQKTEGSTLAIYWLEAIDASASSWNSVFIGNVPAASHFLGAQGYHLADVRGGGKPEIVISSGDGIWYFEVPANPAVDPWTRVHVNNNPSDEGFGVADIDSDGDLDIAAGTGDTKLVEWYRNPGDGSADWQSFTIGNMNESVYPDRFAAVDLNGDNRPDIIGTEENGLTSGAETFWWEAPVDPTLPNWTRHLIATQGSTNSMDIDDIDHDGDVDILLGEHKGGLATSIWQNDGLGNFTEQIVGMGKESHLGVRAVDLDIDGDTDIVSIAYDAPQYIHLWRNDAIFVTSGGGGSDTTSPVISNTTSFNITATGATITWTTDEPSDSQVDYGITTSYGQNTALNAALVTNHSVTLSGLSANTTYHYRVKSKDASGNMAMSEDGVVVTINQVPPTSGLVAAFNFDEGNGVVSQDASGNNISGTLTNGVLWTTAGKNGGALQFDGVDDYVNLGHPSSLSLSSFTLSAWVYPTNLSGDRDIITKVNSSSEYHLQETGGQLQVGFSNGTGSWYYLNASAQSMPLNAWSHITAMFDDDGNAFTLYVNGNVVGTQAVSASILSGTNDVHIGMGWYGQSWSGKIDDVRIYNRVISENEVATDMNTPVGGVAEDTAAPTRSNGLPTGALPETTTEAILSLSTDEPATCKYSMVSGTPYATMIDTFQTTGAMSHSVTLSGLSSGSYTYFVRCEDAAGNQNVDDFAIVFTVATPDLTAPIVTMTAPINGSTVAGTILLSVDASDDRGVDHVDFLIDGAFYSTDIANPYSASVDTTVLSEGQHTFLVRAFDAAGNAAEDSVAVVVENTDVIAPSIPQGLSALAISTTGINLTWLPSSDNVGVVGYKIFRGGNEIGITALSSFSDTDLTPATQYTYAILAYDSSGNESVLSSTAVATTFIPDTTSPVISNTTSFNITATGATITWTTDEPSDSQVDYGITTSYGQNTALNAALVTNHSVTLSGLSANTTYHYRVKSKDASGNMAMSEDGVVVTMSEDGLVGVWLFDEGSGTIAADSSGNNRNGDILNGALWTTGLNNGAVSFDGNNDYVDLPSFDIAGNELTLSAWVKFSSFPANVDQRIISKASGSSESSHYWMLGHTRSGNAERLRVRLRTGNSTKTLVASSGNLSTGVWYHVATTYNGTTIRLYLNGAEVGQTGKTGTLATNASVDVNFGRNPNSYGYLSGALDEVRIYSRALSGNEIQALASQN